MNSKLITAAIIITLSVVGFGIVMLTKEDSPSQDTPTAMTGMEKEGAPQEDPAMENDQAAAGDQVTYKGFAVVQKTLKVKKGTTVTWTNQDSAQHDVTPDTETADFKSSPLFGKNGTYEVTFNTVGSFSYHCSPHPYMKGVIEVVE